MDNLKLENQLCFPLYVCSKEIIKRYKPFLEQIDLTYTQYIVMMVMWEEKEKAKQVPKELEKCIVISEEDRNTLKEMLNRIMQIFN